MHTINGFWHGAASLSGRVDLSAIYARYSANIERCTDRQLREENIGEHHIRRLRRTGPLTSAQRVLLLGQSPYPEHLSFIPFAPPVLFYIGRTELLDSPAIAIVGARKCTQRGIDTARAIAEGVTSHDFVVVSGLAYGIDSAAHFVRPDRTIAVLGQGLDRALRSRKRKSMDRIVDAGGLVVSEFPPLMPASRHTFPQRNRVISGLAQGTVVVEATMRSGSRITARQALEQGRELMVVPGHPMDKNSTGCNALIRDGAALVRDSNDVLECLGHDVRESSRGVPTCPRQTAVLKALQTGDTFDHLMSHTQLAMSALSATLAELELAGWVQRLPGDRISTRSPV